MISKIFESLSTGNIIISLVFILLFLFVNTPKILNFLDSRKKVKLSIFKDALENKKIKGIHRKVLESEYEKLYFKSILGINIEKEFREELFKLYKKTEGSISFNHFRRAIYYMNYEDKIIKIKIPIYEKILFYLNLIFALFFYIIGSFLIISLFLNLELGEFYYLLLLGLFFIFLGIMTFLGTLPFLSASKIIKRLNL